MIELIDILYYIAPIAFWLSMFLQAFGYGSDRAKIYKWGWLCLLIGWVVLVSPGLSMGDIEEALIEISAWSWMHVFIISFFVSSLGSGYFCGRKLKGGEGKR